MHWIPVTECLPDITPHMHIVCQLCGYVWFEAPLDAAQDD